MSSEGAIIMTTIGAIVTAIAASYNTYKMVSTKWEKAFEEEADSHLADVKHYSGALRYIISLQRLSHEEFSRLMRIADGKEQYTPDEERP